MANKIVRKQILSNDRKSYIVVIETGDGDVFVEINQGFNKLVLSVDEWKQLKNVVDSIGEKDVD